MLCSEDEGTKIPSHAFVGSKKYSNWFMSLSVAFCMLYGDLSTFSVDVFSLKPFWACVNILFIETIFTYYTLPVLVFLKKHTQAILGYYSVCYM